MSDAETVLEETSALLTRVAGLEEAVGTLLPDHANLRALARSLVEAARDFSGGLKVATAPMMEQTAEPAAVPEAVPAVVPAAVPAAEPAAKPDAGPAVGPAVGPDAAAEGASGREAAEPEDGGEPEEPRALVLARALVEIKEVIERDNLVVEVNDFRFAEKAGGLIEDLDSASREGQKAARVLFECVRALDVLDRDYSLPGYERLGNVVRGHRREVAEYLKESFDIEFSPDPCVPDSGDPAALAGLLDGLDGEEAKRIDFPSNEPAGRALALRRRGARLPGGTEPPELFVSTGTSTPVFTLVHDLARAVLAPAKVSPRLRQGRAAAAKEIRQKFLSQLVSIAAHGGDTDREATVLRYVANVLQTINKEGALKDLMRPLLAALAERGFKAVPVRMGGAFDESYSTGKYERKSVSSSQPKGTIVEVILIGFVNRDGVPVQKATLGVSSGVPG